MKKVLLVDDDAVLRIGMKTLVDWQQHGYILIGEASDGDQAMELVQQHRPDSNEARRSRLSAQTGA